MVKNHKILTAYILALIIFTVYVVMDTFVIARVYGDVSMQTVSDEITGAGGGDANETAKADAGDEGTGAGDAGNAGTAAAADAGDAETVAGDAEDEGTGARGTANESGTENATISSDSYSDGNISVTISEYNVENTAVYAAEVKADSSEYLKTALANGVYGRNVTQTTSEIAGSVGAILAINGDFYGAREKGYVIRNGELYRDTAVKGQEDLVIYSDGSFGIINEDEVSAEQLLADGAVQTLSFGPALVEDGEISVDADDEVGRAMASNPRTAIGIKADGTYIFVVSDGRTDESEGLSLQELAEFMSSIGAVTAYNLDGGGSSTMVFSGTVVNNPTGGRAGHGSGSERSVSDIVYIGYNSTDESRI